MTTQATPVSTQGAAVATHAGDTGAKWRRRIVYVFLIGYAILMFVPFTWSIVTSFKTLPDSVRLTFIPDPFTTAGWEFAFTELTPPLGQLFLNSFLIAGAVT